MQGHCRTKGHSDKPHRKRESCLDWLGTHQPVYLSSYPQELSDWEDKDTKAALDVMAKEGMVSEELPSTQLEEPDASVDSPDGVTQA